MKSSTAIVLALAGAGAIALVVVMSKKKAAASDLGVQKPVPPLPKPVIPIDADPYDDMDVRRDGDAGILEKREAPPSSSEDRYVPITSMPPETPSTAKWGVTNEDGSAVRPDPSLARSRAQSMADHIRTKKSAYDRPKLAVWQALAGIDADGLYGPGTRTALVNNGAKNVPSALFRGA